MSPTWLFASAFAISAIGGLAAAQRSRLPNWPTLAEAVTAFLNGGLLGLTVALLWFSRYGAVDPHFLLGCCGILGFSGLKALDVILTRLQRIIFGGKNGNGDSDNGK